MKNQKRILSLVMSLMIVIGALLTPTTSEAVNWENKVIDSSYQYNAVEVDLKEIGIDTEKVLGLSLLSNGKRVNSHLNINKDNKVEVLTELKPGTEYDLRVITEDKNYTLKVKVDSLPKIEIKDESYRIRVPAMPDKGFNFPYILTIPSKASVSDARNKRDKNYLLVDTVNSMGTGDYIESLATIASKGLGGSQLKRVSDNLGLPAIMPVIPRTNAMYLETYNGNNYWGKMYEHVLDRDTLFLKNLVEDTKTTFNIKQSLSDFNINPQELYNLDKQILAMFNHAINYLNEGETKVESKVIFTGFSASGALALRFTSLYPEKVKALIAGGALQDVVVPATTYKETELIYPFGVAEHKEITGKDFNKDAYSKVPKLIYMGEEDYNDDFNGSDAFGELERNLMKKVFSENFKTRQDLVRKAYTENGGTGAFVYMKDTGHWVSQDMENYMFEFIRDNINSDTPVYNQPKGNEINKSNLKIEIYK